MPARRIVVSTCNSRRLELAAGHFRALAGASEALVVTETRGAADDFVRLAAPPGGGFCGAHRLTLRQLALELAAEAVLERRLAPLSRLGSEALAARAVAACRAERPLRYFEPVADTPGFARALARTLAELRLQGVTPQPLAATGDSGDDLARLLDRYQQELADRRLADFASLCRLAAASAARSGHRFLGLPIVLLDPAIDSRAVEDLLAVLVEHSPDVFAASPAADLPSTAALARLLATDPESADSLPPSGTLARLQHYVFARDIPAPETAAAPDPSFEFFSAAGEGLEAVEIARRIRQYSFSFDRVAILLRHPDDYLPLVEDALRRAGIPAYFTRSAARPQPAGRAFLALLACAAEGLTASRFAEYLSLGQVPQAVSEPRTAPSADDESSRLKVVWEPGAARPDDSSDETPADPDAPVIAGTLRTPFEWEKMLVDAAVIGGHDRWARRLRGLEEQLRLELAQLDRDGDPRREQKQKDLARLHNLQQFALPLIDFLASEFLSHPAGAAAPPAPNTPHPTPDTSAAGAPAPDTGGVGAPTPNPQHPAPNTGAAGTPAPDTGAAGAPAPNTQHPTPNTSADRRWWKGWLQLLDELARRALRDPDPVLAVLQELRPMEDVGPVTLDEVRGVLSESLGLLRVAPQGSRYGRVFVGSVEEARGRSFDVVFLPGLAEGLFPRPTFEDPLLLDDRRRQLEADLALEDQRVARERLLLRLAAGAAQTCFIASYPRLDVSIGRPRVPSFYALELWRAAEGRLPDLRQLEKAAARAAPSELGWPAPRDPADALDDAEYDLAFLAELERQGRQQERGASHYLLASNPCLARSLRARGRRWRPRWFPEDGLVDPEPATRQLLAAQSLHLRPYSPTALQQYAACPYRFLLYSLHHLRPREPVAALEQLDPRTRGSLFHEVQHRLFRALDQAGLLPLGREAVSAVLDLADPLLDVVAAEYAERLAPAIERVWVSGIEEIRTDLRGWIHELAGLEGDWRPAHFEFSFGLPDSDRPEALLPDEYRLRGRIDLVEADTARRRLRVTDHKTGKPPDRLPRWIGNGELLQPVLYGLATEQLLGAPVDSGVLFYATQRGEYRRVEIRLDHDARLRAALVLRTIEEALQQGFLPAAPRPGACEYCDYRPVCGPYEERRVQHKDQDPLDPLVNLRNTP